MITPNQLAEVIVKIITGREYHRPAVVNVSKNFLYTIDVDLSFEIGLEDWADYVDAESEAFKKSKNILDYYIYMHTADRYSTYEYPPDQKIIRRELRKHVAEECKKAFNEDIEMLITEKSFYDKNSTTYYGSNYDKRKVNICFNRSIVSHLAIKTVIEQGSKYGKRQGCTKNIKLKIEFDHDSEITNMRLHFLKTVAENLLKFQSYDVESEEFAYNYIYTVKSEGKIDDGYKRYLCGAVLNEKENKETALTEDIYLQRKIDKVKELNVDRHPYVYIDQNNIEEDIQKIANASIIYELLSIKHTSPVILKNSDYLDRSIKETSFILYNNIKITSILDKYAKLELEDEFPEITPFEDVRSEESNDIAAWNLIYNYIIKYPDILDSAVTVEPELEINIELLWSFISNLCNDFNKYYRRNRILMKGLNSDPTILEIASQRLHMLRALRIILRNLLSLLEVE